MQTKFRFLLVFIMGVSMFSFVYRVPKAFSRTISGPYIVNPPWSIGAPNDKVEFVLNITKSEIGIKTVKLFYVIRNKGESAPSKIEEYCFLPMKLFSETDSILNWRCTLVPKENNQIIYFLQK